MKNKDVIVEVVFNKGEGVTRHVMKAPAKKMAKSKTTIGELFRRLHLAKP